MNDLRKDDGGPAFPQVVAEIQGIATNSSEFALGGMSLRDYFAGQALSSFITAYLAVNGNGCAADHALRNVPALAFKYADAMLKERAK